MKKSYVLYMLGMGISVVALATRTSIIYPDYLESIFYVVNMILLSSVLLIFFLEEKYKTQMNKFLILTGFFFLLSWGLNILKNIVVINTFGVEAIQMFLILFLMCGVGSALLTSISMHDETLIKKNSLPVLVYIPVIIYTLWIIFSNPYRIGRIIYLSINFRLFLVLYVSTYASITLFLFVNRGLKALPLRQKLFVLSTGLFITELSDVLREIGLFSPLMSVFSLCGIVMVCFSFLFEPTLKVYTKLFNKMLSELSESKAEGFKKELKKQINNNEKLHIRINNLVRVIDNPRVANVVEKKEYDEVLLKMIDWYSKNVKKSDKIIKTIKKDYSEQMRISRQTAPVFI